MILIIEDANGREKMLLRKEKDKDSSLTAEERQKGTWRSNFCANSMIGTLKAWKERYGFDIVFCDRSDTATEMIQMFYKFYCEAKEAKQC